MLGLILDHNGPIVEAQDFWAERSHRTAVLLGVPWSEEWHNHWETQYLKVTIGEICLPDYYGTLSGLSLTGDEVEKLTLAFVSKERLADPRIPGYMTRLNGMGARMALLSNYATPWVITALKQFGIEDVFHTVLVSDGLRRRKPDPSTYAEAARSLGLEPTDCTYVGDTVSDLDAAAKVGMEVRFIPGEETTPGQHRPIRNLGELEYLLR